MTASGIALHLRAPRCALLIGALMLLAGMAARADPPVAVSLTDQGMESMKMQLSTTQVRAGRVTFEVTNRSEDLVHEFVVTRWDKPIDMVPYDAEENEAAESNLAVVNEIDGLDPGQSGTLTVTLDPGTYMLLCNKAGHFKAGMVHLLTVTP